MENLKYLRTTSKKSLLESAVFVAHGDYDKAAKIYDYYASRMDLPDMDVVPPSTISQITEKAGSAFTWINDNKDSIIEWVSTIKAIVGKGQIPMPQVPVTPLPNI